MSNQPSLGRRRGPAIAWALLTVLAMGGCGFLGGSDAESDHPATAAVSPADGSDVSACGDGNCEILVSGPVEIKVNGHGGINTLSVVKVAPPGLSFTLKSDGGTGSGELQPNCTLTFHKYGEGSSCGGPQTPPPEQTGVLALQVAGTAQGGVVLRLTSGEVGEPPASLRPPKIEVPSLPNGS